MSILYKNYGADITIIQKGSDYYGLDRDGVQQYRDGDLSTVANDAFTDYGTGFYLLFALEGLHTITTTLAPNHNTRIEGTQRGDVAATQQTGTILKADDALSSYIISFTAGGSSYSRQLYVSNLGFDGNASNTDCGGIWLRNPARCEISHCQFRYMGDPEPILCGYSDILGFHNWIHHNYIDTFNLHGIKVFNADENWIDHNVIGTGSLDYQDDGTFDQEQAAAIYCTVGMQHINKNTLVQCNGHGMTLSGSGFQVIGNEFDKIERKGINMITSGNGVNISDNDFYRPSYTHTGTYDMIYANNYTYVRCTNNSVRTTSEVPDYCIHTVGTSDYWQYYGNDMRYYNSGQVSMAGANNSNAPINWA